MSDNAAAKLPEHISDNPSVKGNMHLLTSLDTSFTKIYLSGAMTGLPELNYPEFNRVARILREAGHAVYNPAEYCSNNGIEEAEFPKNKAFKEYTDVICLWVDAIVMLPNWENSDGARAEYYLAKSVGTTIIFWPDTPQSEPALTSVVKP